MDQFLDPISLYIVGGLLTVLLVVLLLRSNRTTSKTAPGWLIGVTLGLAVGCGATFLTMHRFGYHWESQYDSDGGDPGAPPMGMGGPGGGMGGPPAGGMMGMGGPGGGMGGPGGGMGGPGGGMGMGSPDPATRARRELTTLVGKLDLLTARPPFELSADQSQALSGELAKLEAAEELSQGAIEEHVEKINEILNEEQKQTLAAIGLPRPAGGGGGPGGGAGGQPAAGGGNAGRRPPIEGEQPATGGSGGGAAADINENPFREGGDQKRLREVLGRLKGGAAAEEGDAKEGDTAQVDDDAASSKSSTEESSAPDGPPNGEAAAKDSDD